MILDLWRLSRAVWRFRDYKPQKVTINRITQWLGQFDKSDRSLLLKLLDEVTYVSELQTQKMLIESNNVLLEKLRKQGIPPSRIIYVQIDDAGSSSAVMLNMLRDGARLERRYKFLDSRNVRGIHDVTNKIGEGAIIFVDDFIGTGNQLSRSRDFVNDFVVGTFSQFVLCACICQEGVSKLGERGIQPVAGMFHAFDKRPLHELNYSWPTVDKDRLIDLGTRLGRRGSLGYKELATMVVLYRNTPNTAPWLLRGNVTQKPFSGILPRTTDLPARP